MSALQRPTVRPEVVPGWKTPSPRPLSAAPEHRSAAPPPRMSQPEPLWREVAGSALRAERISQRRTLRQVAERAGLSPQYLSEVERGRKEPSSEMLASLCGALGLTLADLLLAVVPAGTPAAVRSITGGRPAGRPGGALGGRSGGVVLMAA